MPVSSLVITFGGNVTDFPNSMQQLNSRTGIEVGQANGPKLAIVMDSDSQERDQENLQWVRELPGVEFVDVAFVELE